MLVNADTEKEKKHILALTNGNERSFDFLFRAYGQRVYHFAKGLLKNREEAEEIVQETFIKIWEHRAEINPDLPFAGFLFTVAHRLVLNRIRRIKVEENARNYFGLRAKAEGNYTEETVHSADFQRMAAQAIDNLPPRRKVIFRMVKEDHMSYQQVADHLNISVKTVESQMTEALRFLRSRISIQEFLLIGLIRMLL